MNTFQLLWLLREIYSDHMPNLEKIESLGLLSVKIAQMHALRTDFLGAKKCRQLAKLYQRTQASSPEHIDEVLKRAPDKYHKRISKLNSKPFASASVGQVHRAKHSSGQDVVVKVIKQDAKQDFLDDIKRVNRFMKIVSTIYPRLKRVGNPLGIIKDIERFTLPELDLRNEITGREELKKAYSSFKSKVKLPRLKFVKTYPELSSKDILVSDFLHGKSLDELMRNKKLHFQEILDLFEIHGSFLFVAGIYHGDLHPGNAILQEGKLYLIDTSYVARAPKRIRQQLFKFFQALSIYDYDACINRLLEMSLTKVSKEGKRRFSEKFLELYDDYKGKTVAELSLTKQMMDSIKLGVECGMELSEEVFPIIKSLMYMDGMVLGVKPNVVLMEEMRPYLQKFKKHVLN